MERPARAKLNTQIYEEAAEWFIECRSGDLDDSARAQFNLWLRKSPEHLAAYIEIAALWSEGPSLDPEKHWDTSTLIAQASQDRDNIVAISAPRAEEAPPRAHTRPAPVLLARFRPRSRAAAVAAGMLAVGFLVAGTAWQLFWQASTYATETGEQRSLAFEDGSTVELNSRSRLRVRYSDHERDVDLLEGQALFHVAKDPSRPFIVRSGDTRVRAVGTQFDVYKKPEGTVVTVVEGRVAVSTPVAGEPPDLLVAGDQLTVTPKAAEKVAHPNIANATAWTQRRLVFDSASLAEVAEEFNRYNERKLVIEDPSLVNFHISGVFSSTDPASLIRFLRERPQLRIDEHSSEIVVTFQK